MSGFLEQHNLDVGVLMKRGSALLDAARRAGADKADAVIVAGRNLAISVLNGKVEEHESAEGDDFGLRVMVGKRQAIVSGNTLDDRTAETLAERAVAMAKAATENPYADLAEENQRANLIPHLDLFDPTDVSIERLRDLAIEAESAAQAVKGVTKSAGASANSNHGSFLLLSSEGFAGAYATSLYSVSTMAIAGEGTKMERDYDGTSKRHFADLLSASEIGRSAGERAARRIGAKKIASGRRKVIFDRRPAGSLLSHFAQGINGENIVRRNSFLIDALGTQLFSADIVITDDPLVMRGYRSRPFDGEGVRTQKRSLVDRGIVTTWLLDCANARELGLKSTGHAERGISSMPRPASTNLTLQPGRKSLQDFFKEIGDGLYVTDLIGHGANILTGDYSCGCSGFLIENGELTIPVNEITIAGTLKQMYGALQPANDLEIRSSVSAPSCYVGEMMIAGL